MSATLQTLATLLVIVAAAVYLMRRTWRSYVQALHARTAKDGGSPCGPDCGCEH